MTKQNQNTQKRNPAGSITDNLIKAYQSGEMAHVESEARELLVRYPDSEMVLNILGASLQSQGKVEDAIEVYDRAIKSNPKFAEAHNNKGNALKELGRGTEALASYEHAVALAPKFFAAFKNLGVALTEQGRPEEAIKAFDQAIELKPDFVEAYVGRVHAKRQLQQFNEALIDHQHIIQHKPRWIDAYLNYGDSLKNLGRLDEAVAIYEKAIAINPEDGRVYNNWGVVLVIKQEYRDALAKFHKSIECDPDNISAYGRAAEMLERLGKREDALTTFKQMFARKKQVPARFYNNCGNILIKVGDYESAVRLIKKAISLRPEVSAFHSNCGAAHNYLGAYKESLEYFDAAIELNPDFGEAYANRGGVYQQLGDYEAALRDLDHSIELVPEHANAYKNKAIIFTESGRFEEAIKLLEKALELDPTFAEAHRTLSQYKKYAADDPQISIMERLVNEETTTDNDRIHLSFSLAKACEDLGDYSASYRHLKTANDLIKQRLGYSIDNDRAVFVGTKKLFTRGIPSLSTFSDNTGPIFIVGMPRSGTTLTEQILASHSKVHGAGELTAMGDLTRPLIEPRLNDPSLPDISIEEVGGIRDGYQKVLEALAVSEQVIVDKMPTNFRLVGFILSAFPGAKIVHMNRDPMAVCWSNYKHYFAATGFGPEHSFHKKYFKDSKSGSGHALGFSSDLNDIAEFYNLYLDMMAFWREKFPGCIYDLDYEKLTLNQEDETRKLLEYCELSWEDSCLDFHKTTRAVKTASLSQVRKKIYTGSSKAWKKYEKYLEPLKNNLLFS